MSNQINTEDRAASTKSTLKQLRATGKVPAVVYGESVESATVTVEEKQLNGILRSNPNAILQMEVPGQGTHPVMIGEIQRDPVTRNILHIDFQQINVKNPIKVMVRVDFTGEAAGSREGGILQTPLTELEIECLPHLIPTSIPVDVSELNVGDSLLVSELQPPAEITVITDGSEVIASVLAPQAEVVDEDSEAAEEAEAAEDAEGAAEEE